MNVCQVFLTKCDQGLQLTMSLMLKREGFNVVMVDDCLEAYSQYQEMKTQDSLDGVILLDLSGQRPLIEKFLDVCQRNQDEISVIVLYEYGEESNEGLCLKQLGASMISKPFEPYILIKEVKNKLSEKNNKRQKAH